MLRMCSRLSSCRADRHGGECLLQYRLAACSANHMQAYRMSCCRHRAALRVGILEAWDPACLPPKQGLSRALIERSVYEALVTRHLGYVN